ncbi:MAG: phosphotransferase family protein [Panacagrimonas sp.]
MNAAVVIDSHEPLARQLATHLAAQFGKPAQVHGLARLTGGSSNETWSFDLQLESVSRVPLVLRRCFAASPLDVRLDIEFQLLATLHRLGLPVPQPLCCVMENSPLQSPFMIVSRASGTDVRKLLAQTSAAKPDIGWELVAVLARIHAVDWQHELGTVFPPTTGNVALAEIERWAPDIEAATPPSPLLEAALDWLRAEAPANARLCLVHGDFKANNLLYGEGRTQAVIDWELAHLGDPHEDLAWTMLWDTEHDLVKGLLAKPDFLAAYAATSGTVVDERRLFFWQVFSLLKLAAIFLRGLATATPDAPARPMLIQLARALPHLEHRLASLVLAALDEEPAR